MEIQIKIKNCFELDKVLYTKHALQEMEMEEFGEIYDKEIEEVIIRGKIIEKYLDDKPYISLLIYESTAKSIFSAIFSSFVASSPHVQVVRIWLSAPHSLNLRKIYFLHRTHIWKD